ncbi:SCF ubiquitin ligase complex subunit cdc4 [Myotisia sp. PD_48]|nr:SCF ubiquitin ligase complex subunit cdc4 [Myotisia sp. PD_48]
MHDMTGNKSVSLSSHDLQDAADSPAKPIEPFFRHPFPPSLTSVEGEDNNLENPVCSSSLLGQFSFAPATQTTVVTTTTTTTTKFPPFVMRDSKAFGNLDQKLYPLASMPTPETLRDIRFNLDGKPILFREIEQLVHSAPQRDRQLQPLDFDGEPPRSNPRISSLDNNQAVLEKINPPCRRRFDSDIKLRRRPVSPISLLDSSQEPRRTRKLTTVSFGSRTEKQTTSLRPQTSSQLFSFSNTDPGLATPETESASFISHEPDRQLRRLNLELKNQISTKSSKHNLLTRNASDGGSPVQHPREESIDGSFDDHLESFPLEKFRGIDCSQSTDHSFANSLEGPSERKVNKSTNPQPLMENQRRPGLLFGQLNDSQDMTLPSPSLSPITAMNTRRLDVSDSIEDQGSETDSTAEYPPTQDDRDAHEHVAYDAVGKNDARTPTSFSLAEMPGVLNYFESMPDELKSYMIYQFLRRCPKPTLQIVADAVSPALKCDFLSSLPLELSLNIVKYFDVQTMCKASQVCKKWRHIINSDEKSWQRLFHAAGFELSEWELRQAIEQGWGWQFPKSTESFEIDMRLTGSARPESENSTLSKCLSGTSSHAGCKTVLTPFSPSTRRPKRKASLSLKRASKRKAVVIPAVDKPVSTCQFRSLTEESPYVAANEAAMAIPYPEFGLPSLRSLHLYKSLYQRHHLIYRNWMRGKAKPMHLAFRAHDHHVVTCLQFDSDKILTGSDDTNINVYDTRTGALKSTLQGHDGGVWALEYHGNTLVSGSTDRSVRVWDIEAAKCTQVFQGHTSTVRCLQILLPTEIGKMSDGTSIMRPKEPLIITGSRDSTLRVWKLPKPGDPKYFQSCPPQDDTSCPYFVRVMLGHTNSVRAIAAHGDTLVSGSYDTSVRVWKISTGEPVHLLQGHAYKVYSVVLDHKRNRCISGSMDNLVKIWSLETGTVLYNLEGHTSLVGLLDLNSDRLVSAAADSTLRIWDPKHGHCKNILNAHTGAITCFQHDEQKVISGSDRTLKMWNVKTGECTKDLLTGLSGVWQVKFNNRRCVAAVQRNRLTYIEVLDFGAYRDGVPHHRLGQRILVNQHGEEIREDSDDELDPNAPEA